MKFEVKMTVEVNEPDVDVMDVFEKAVMDGFAGTAIKVRGITVIPKSADPTP